MDYSFQSLSIDYLSTCALFVSDRGLENPRAVTLILSEIIVQSYAGSVFKLDTIAESRKHTALNAIECIKRELLKHGQTH